MYLGIDLGTSGLKALLIDEAQRPVGSATAPLTVSRPHPGWSEQDPADWVAAAEAAIERLRRDHAPALAAVKGIGLSGQMHGATLLDASDRPLRPCILWNDTRSHAEASLLDTDPRFRAISGNIVFSGFTAPKLVWVKAHEPKISAATAKVLLPKDYLRLWLTGEAVSEMSDAAGTSWLDTRARAWSPELLDASLMRPDQMPRLVEGTESSGALRRDLAARWGMGPSVAVAGGAGDNAASAVGVGTVAAGSAFVSLGTSGVLFAATDSYLPSPETAVHSFCHALPGRWHQMGVILSATASLDWFAGISGTTSAALLAEIDDKPAGPGSITFLPYLSGERTPHNDARIRGAFVGLAHEHDRAAMTRAVLEGVVFALRDCLEAMRAAGASPERLTAVGGGTRAPAWTNLIATVLGIPVDLPAEGDFGAAFGAARLGLMAATGADPTDVCTPPAIAHTAEPRRQLTGAYDEAYGRYRALYPAIAALASRAG